MGCSDRDAFVGSGRWSEGPPLAHLTRVSFTVKLPGYSGDSVSAAARVDDRGHLTVEGSGPLSDLDVLGRLDTRAVIDAIENLVDGRLSRPIRTETEEDEAPPG